MAEPEVSLRLRYGAALERHLAEGNEETLMAAWALGRSALEEGSSLLDLVSAHHDTVAPLGPAPTEWARAGQFLAEALAPFEMAYQGYRSANLELQGANRQLEARNRELKRANEAAGAARRDLESFSYSVSHDLRAPLRAIDGFSQALKDDFGDRLPPEGLALLDRVRAAAQRMGQLIDDLLALAQVARAELSKTRLDLSALALSVGEALRQQAPNRDVELRVEPGLEVEADPGLMRIVLENLLGNAWKFTSRKERARIEVGHAPGGFYVKDDGAGFDMGARTRLFGAFQRLHTAAEFEGSGIGLATVQRIIVRHGGQLTALGEPGKGATFTIWLPGEVSSRGSEV